MRKLLSVAAFLLAASGLVAAQRHMNQYEIPVKGELTVSSDVMLGSNLLKEGTYSYHCDRRDITFANPKTGQTVLKVPCEGREMQEPFDVTALHTKTDPSGKKVVTKLLLKGSNIEHVFR